MIISIDSNKDFTKIQNLFMIKNMQQIKNRRKLPQASTKCTTNAILHGKRLKAFTLRLVTRKGIQLLPLQFSIVLEVLVRN